MTTYQARKLSHAAGVVGISCRSRLLTESRPNVRRQGVISSCKEMPMKAASGFKQLAVISVLC